MRNLYLFLRMTANGKRLSRCLNSPKRIPSLMSKKDFVSGHRPVEQSLSAIQEQLAKIESSMQRMMTNMGADDRSTTRL